MSGHLTNNGRCLMFGAGMAAGLALAGLLFWSSVYLGILLDWLQALDFTLG